MYAPTHKSFSLSFNKLVVAKKKEKKGENQGKEADSVIPYYACILCKTIPL